jgi:hypothetical protein
MQGSEIAFWESFPLGKALITFDKELRVSPLPRHSLQSIPVDHNDETASISALLLFICAFWLHAALFVSALKYFRL